MLLIHVEVSWSRLQGTSAWENSNPEGLVMTCILPMALYDDGSWLRDSDIWSLCYGFYSAQTLFQVVSLRALAIASLNTWRSLCALPKSQLTACSVFVIHEQ